MDTGWIAATSASNADAGSNTPAWSNVANIYSDNNSYATVPGLRSGSTPSDYLTAGFPAIDIPAYATDIRVAVRVRHKKSGATYCSAQIGYYVFGVPIPLLSVLFGGTALRVGFGEPFSTSEVAELFGGDSDALWYGVVRDITPTDVAAGVSVRLRVWNGNDISTTAYIDQVEVKFWYSAETTTTEISADIVAESAVAADIALIEVVSASIEAEVSIEAVMPGEAIARIEASATVTADPVYYDPSEVEVGLCEADLDASAAVFAEVSKNYISVAVWDDSGLVAGSIQFDLVSGVSVGGVSSQSLHDMLEYDADADLVIAVGIESDYADVEAGFFAPAELSLQFFLKDPSLSPVAFKLFQLGVSGVRVVRNSDARTVAVGRLDRESVVYEFARHSLSASFAVYVDPDERIKSGSSSLDVSRLSQVFGFDISFTGNSLDPSQWLKVKRVFEVLLTSYGADSVEFGNFNRLFTSVVLQTTEDVNNTYSAAGWQNAGSQTFAEWLASATPNILFDRLLVYKEMLFQSGDYSSVGASDLKDVVSNLSKWFLVVWGVDASGKGFVVPSYAQEGEETITDEQVLSCSIKGYLPKIGQAVGIGKVFPGKYNPDPGQCFFTGGYYYYNLRYDLDAVHYSSLYTHTALYEVTLSGEEVMKVFFPVSPTVGTIRSGMAEAFGYTAASGDTHNGDLKAVWAVGSEVGWNAGGSRGYYIDGDASYIDAVTEKYFEYRRVDREIYEVEILGVDLEMVKLYQLDPTSRYGSGVLLRPIRIQTNYSRGITLMEAVNVSRT
jgi:hypothetical protein